MPARKPDVSEAAAENKIVQEARENALPKSAFTSETAKKANAKAQTPEAKAKAAQTRKTNVLIRHAIYDKLKEDYLMKIRKVLHIFKHS